MNSAAERSPTLTGSISMLTASRSGASYGLDIDAYRVTLRRIRECIPRVIEVIEQLSPPAANAAAAKIKNNVPAKGTQGGKS